MPQEFRVHARVRDEQGSPRGDARIRLYDADLPSLERQGRTNKQAIAAAESGDGEGRFELQYTEEAFRRADKTNADLTFRVDGRDGRAWRITALSVNDERRDPALPVFNAPADCRIDLTVEVAPELSEHERIVAEVIAAAATVPIEELTREDVEFLARETGFEPRLIDFVRAAAELSVLTDVPAAAFYGWARTPLPELWNQLFDRPENDERRQALEALRAHLVAANAGELRDALMRASHSRVIPDLREQLQSIIRRLQQRDQAEHVVTLRLLDSHDQLPLEGAEIKSREPFVARGLTDVSGNVVLRLRGASPPPDQDFELLLAVHLADGTELQERIAAKFAAGTTRAEVLVRVPRGESASLTALNSAGHLQLPGELVETLTTKGIHNLAQIRRAGGIKAIKDLPEVNAAALRRLQSLADLNRVSPDISISKTLVGQGYGSVLDIARTPRSAFISALSSPETGLDDQVLGKLHLAATAQVRFLDGLLTGEAAANANGYKILSAAGEPADDNPITARCACSDCESAVSPAAYLADLMDYALRTLRSDGDPLTLSALAERIHQPLTDLPAECGAVEKPVRQARICIEVIRSVLGARPLLDAATETALSAAERQHCETTYHLLLTALGTSYGEIRLARVAPEEQRQALASRLGITLSTPRKSPPLREGDELDQLFLDPDAAAASPERLSEGALERLFGLASTTRDPLSDGLNIRDEHSQLTRWSFSGLTWGVATDTDGVMHARLLKLAPNAYQLVFYSDADQTNAVAVGESTSADGSMRLIASAGSRLSGSARIRYTADDTKLAISAIPAMLAWRLRHLRALWTSQDFPSDRFELADGPPLIDPDLIAPADFRHPQPANAAFSLWISRRSLVDQWLQSVHQQRVQNSLDYAIQQTLAVAASTLESHAEILSGSGNHSAVQASSTAIAALGLTVEAFLRLWEIRRAAARNDAVGQEAWSEAESILVQSRKVRSSATWRTEERNAGIALDGEVFWRSVHDPAPGVWPPPAAQPLIDPDSVKAAEIENLFGETAETLRSTRAQHLKDLRSALEAERIAQGFDAMLRLALGHPKPGDPLEHDVQTLLQDLDAGGAAAATAATRIEQDLHLSQADFRRITAVRARLGVAGAPQPSDADWELIYAALTRARKLKQDHPAWRTEEQSQNLVYWRALLPRLPLWRASAAARHEWQQALNARTRRPLIDPDVVRAQDLRTVDPGNVAFKLWDERRGLVNGWRAAYKAQIAAAPDALSGWKAVISDQQGLDIDAAALSQLAEAAKAGANIQRRLDQLHLTTASFGLVARLGELAQADQRITEAEWDALSRIATEARKRRSFAKWRAEERQLGIVLASTFFNLSAEAIANLDDLSPPTFELWQARRDWRAELQARLEQETGVVQAFRAGVASVEEAALPALRDGLLLRVDPFAASLEQAADRFARRFMIDSRMDGCAITTRVAQASESLQTLLWSARSGQLVAESPQALEDFAVAAWGPGQLHMIARSADNRLWHRVLDSRWQPWTPFGEPPVAPGLVSGLSRPALTSPTPGQLDLVVQAPDRHLWTRSYHGRWSDWRRLDGEVTGDPAAVRTHTGALEVFVRRIGDSAVLRRTFEDGAWTEEVVTSSSSRSPAVAASAAGRLDVITGDPSPNLFRPVHRWFDGTWQEETLDNMLGGEPVLVSPTPNRLELMQNRGGHLWSKTRDSAWQSWTDLDATAAATFSIQGTPAACVPEAGRIELFARRRDLYWQRTFTTAAGWGEWQQLALGDFSLHAPDFDEEWRWIGAYSSWRAAKFVYISPEDYLHPALVARKTPAFRRIVHETQVQLGLNPRRACELATEYASYLADVCTLNVLATCQARTTVRLSASCGPQSVITKALFYQFARAQSGKLYWTATDPHDKPAQADIIWHEVPMVDSSQTGPRPRATRIIGAIPYGTNEQASIALFYEARISGGEPKLFVTRFDLLRFDMPAFTDSPAGLSDAWSSAPVEIGDLLRPQLSKVKVVPVVYDTPPPLPALVLHDFSQSLGVYLRTVDPATGKWEGKAGEWDLVNSSNVPVYRIQPRIPHGTAGWYDDQTVNRLEAAVRCASVTWLVYLSGGRRYAFPLGSGAFQLSEEPGKFYAALPADGGPSPGSVFYVFQQENAENVYCRIGDKLTATNKFPTLEDIDRMAVHSGVVSSQQHFVYLSLDGFTYGFRYAESGTRLTGSTKYIDLPQLNNPRDVPMRLLDGWFASRQSALDLAFQTNERAPPSVLTPLKEAFYFVPMQLALKLQMGGYHQAALDLMRTVYDYAAASDRTIYPGLDTSAALPVAALQQATVSWLLDPLNPHRIAETRRGAYLRYTTAAIARCFAEAGDAEFTRDTPESRARARTYYTSALDVLNIPEVGHKPDDCGKRLTELLIQPGVEVPDEVQAGLGEITDQLTRSGILTTPGGVSFFEKLKIAVAGGQTWQMQLSQARELAATALSKAAQNKTMGQAVELNSAAVAGAHDQLISSATVDLAAQAIGLKASELLSTSAELATEVQVLSGNGIALGGIGSGGAGSAPPAFFLAPQFQFCVPPSPALTLLRSHIGLNLWKLRTCRNIAGIKREQEMYSAPTDTLSGRPTLDSAGQIALPADGSIRPTLYRYSTLIERAKQLANLAAQVEAQMLAALEHRDQASYDFIRARQDLALAEAGVQLQAARLAEAQASVSLAELQRDRAALMREHYTQLLAQPISQAEQAAINYLENAARYASISQDLYIWSAAIQGISIGIPILSAAGSGFLAGSATGGLPGGLLAGGIGAFGAAVTQLGPISQLLQTAASSYTSRASQYSTLSSIQSALASYERRTQEWIFQQALSTHDISIGLQQVTIANAQVNVVQQEGANAALQASNARETAQFLANRFTNRELYDWMSTVLEGVYRFFLQQATVVANLAWHQVAFEWQEAPPAKIASDYWSTGSDSFGSTTDRKGLTGSARLLQDIAALDQHAFLTRQRKLNLTSTISLARLAPAEFQRFRETGVMRFATPMELFDRDFPGHYLRLIQRVKTSVIALIPPSQGVHATLTSSGISRAVIGPEIFQVTSIRRDPEVVALSSPMNASGLFELEPQQAEMLLPFEGNGVDTSWEFSMPKAANAFDYRTIADVLISIEYSALGSYDYRQQVIRSLSPNLQGERAFSLCNDFPDAWYDLHNPELLAEEQRMTVRVRTVREDFPPHLDRLRVDQVLLQVSRRDGGVGEISNLRLNFIEMGTVSTVGGSATTVEGRVSTRTGNGGGWMPLIGKSPFGVWEITLPRTEQMVRLFKDERIEDVLLVVSYSGRLPDWPA